MGVIVFLLVVKKFEGKCCNIGLKDKIDLGRRIFILVDLSV